ncbi:MAG TPA: DMT family transporter [Actinomycetota bacterium]|nr:DMT family transporter [Actinomycetota bacterium]
MEATPTRRRDAGLLLLLTPLIWGLTFPAGKEALERLPLLPFTAWSRLLGVLTLALTLPFLVQRARLEPRRLIVPGLVLGGLMFVAFLLQSAGLQRTTATNAGFVTGLYVVFTPVLGLLLFRRPVARAAWVAVGISVVGLALLSVPGLDDLAPRPGDLLVLASALVWAGHVVGVGFFAGRHPALPLALAQLVGAAAFHLVATAGEGLHLSDAIAVWPLLVITGVLGSGVAFTIQVVAQGSISPTRAAIILAGESVVAAAAAAIWLGERLEPHQWVGAALAVAAMVLSEVGARRRPELRLDPATAV